MICLKLFILPNSRSLKRLILPKGTNMQPAKANKSIIISSLQPNTQLGKLLNEMSINRIGNTTQINRINSFNLKKIKLNGDEFIRANIQQKLPIFNQQKSYS